MPRLRNAIGGVLVAATLVGSIAGCGGTSKAQSSDSTSGMTFAIPTTTLPIDQRMLTLGDLGGKWESAGKIDYQSVYGDQPQQCFYNLDHLDSGATDTESASFKYGEGLPTISQVVFSFQTGAAKPAVSEVADDLDGCGSFSIPVPGGTVDGSVAQAKLDLRGLSDVHVYSVDYHDATEVSKGMILLGYSGDSVLLVIVGSGSTLPDNETARQVFQVAIDKFTTGQIHNEDRMNA